ncbi:MAG: hypothetical protein AB1567_06710 [bacterium]
MARLVSIPDMNVHYVIISYGWNEAKELVGKNGYLQRMIEDIIKINAIYRRKWNVVVATKNKKSDRLIVMEEVR